MQNGTDSRRRANATAQRYREANREKVRASVKRWQQANPDKVRAYVQAHREIFREATKRNYWRHRQAVFDHYGWCCVCCGSAERLSIDHIAGDGGKHRRQIGNGRPASSAQLYRWLIANGFPPGFQTLCRRCNLSKGDRAACQFDHGSRS
jgi:hypothetical protein